MKDGWVTIAAAESGGPSLVVDECTMGRIVAAWNRLAAPTA